MTEAYKLVVVIIIAGAPVPTACRLCGTELDESEGHIGAHKRMAVSTCSDVLIDILGEVWSSSCIDDAHKEQ